MSRRAKGEGSYRLRPDGRWEARLTVEEDGRRSQRSFFGKTKDQARLKMLAAQRRIDENLPVMPEKLTLEAHLKTWLAEKQKTLRPETYRAYNDRCRLYLIPEIGKTRLVKLTIQDIQQAYGRIGQKVSGTTVQHCHGVLRAALQDALRWGLVGRNVAALVTAPRRSTGEMKFLNADDARALLQAAKGEQLEAFVTLAVTAGLREGELQALRWKDVDLARQRLRVMATLTTVKDGEPVFGEPKTQHSRRTVWLSALAVEALERQSDAQDAQRRAAGDAWREHGLVFPNAVGLPMWRSRIRREFRELLKKAELPDMRVHDLRHTAASMLLADGVPVKVVSELLGHSDVKTTLSIYAHTIEGAQEQAASAIDRLFHA